MLGQHRVTLSSGLSPHQVIIKQKLFQIKSIAVGLEGSLGTGALT